MHVDDLALRAQHAGSGGICREILGELPEWFGIPAAVDEYVERADRCLTVVASRRGDDVGFLTLVDHGPHAAEIYVMGVRPAFHRCGIGRRLVEYAERHAAQQGAEYLQVKTLSERRPDPRYAATLAFYTACGFVPLEELPHLWGEANPALQLVKHLGVHGGLRGGVQGGLHHVELWVPDLARAAASFGWLLEALGYEQFQDWPAGGSWRCDGHYVVVEESPAKTADDHDRLRPGLNHLAFSAGAPADVDRLVAGAPSHGWRLLFPDRHPHAGGASHYAAYLENADGFEVELVADTVAGSQP